MTDFYLLYSDLITQLLLAYLCFQVNLLHKHAKIFDSEISIIENIFKYIFIAILSFIVFMFFAQFIVSFSQE